MKSLCRRIARFLKAESGPTAVEYAVIVALVFLVCITAIVLLGHQTNASFEHSSQEINTSLNGGK